MDDEYLDPPEPESEYVLGRVEGVHFRSDGKTVITSQEVQGPLAIRIQLLTKTQKCRYDPREFQYE